MVSRGCWAGAAPTVYSPEFWSQSGAPGLEASSRRRICGLSFLLDSLRVKRPDAYGPGLLRAGSLWGRAVDTASHRARLFSVPLGDRSANPATDGASGRSGLQRVLLSVSSTQKCSGAVRLVSRAVRSAISCWSSTSGHRASLSKYTSGQSRETGSLSRSPGGVGAPAKRVSLGPA